MNTGTTMAMSGLRHVSCVSDPYDGVDDAVLVGLGQRARNIGRNSERDATSSVTGSDVTPNRSLIERLEMNRRDAAPARDARVDQRAQQIVASMAALRRQDEIRTTETRAPA